MMAIVNNIIFCIWKLLWEWISKVPIGFLCIYKRHCMSRTVMSIYSWNRPYGWLYFRVYLLSTPAYITEVKEASLLCIHSEYVGASLVAQLVKNLPAMQETWVWSWVGKTPWRRERIPTPVFWPGEFHGLYSPWGRKESDTTEQLSLHFTSEYVGRLT